MYVKCLAHNPCTVSGDYCYYEERYKGLGSSHKIHHSFLYCLGKNNLNLVLGSSHHANPCQPPALPLSHPQL